MDHNPVLLQVLLLWLIPKLTCLLAIQGPLDLFISHALLVFLKTARSGLDKLILWPLTVFNYKLCFHKTIKY